MPAIIVGGGWAGLAAAIELTRHHIPVVLLESAGQLGGRARTVHYRDRHIDNGQHLILGAYRETLRLLKAMGIDERDVFERHRLKLQIRASGHPDTRITLPRLPAPLHVIFGLAAARGLSAYDRWCGLKMCFALISTHPIIKTDISVYELLDQQGQTDKIIKTLWQPLCLAMLNTPIATASAEIFIKSLKDAFANHRNDSDLLHARSNLGGILPEPAHRYIEQQGGTIRLNARVKKLHIEHNKIHGVELADSEVVESSHVILAVPPASCKSLLEPHPAMSGLTALLSQMDHVPICTVYLQYPSSTYLKLSPMGSVDTAAQWIFDRAGYGQPGLMAVVISSDGPHMRMDNMELCQQVIREVAGMFPDWPEPDESFVIREKQATFLCRKGINTIRPATTTPVAGCLLAGDYTATEYPATLEGAVRSGIEAAQYIIKDEASSLR